MRGQRRAELCRRHRDCDITCKERPKEVTLLYWMMVIVMAGVGFGWVNVRRRRKAAGPKTA